MMIRIAPTVVVAVGVFVLYTSNLDLVSLALNLSICPFVQHV